MLTQVKELALFSDYYPTSIKTTYIGETNAQIIPNLTCSPLISKSFPKRGPEARLHWAMVSGIMFPVGMFIYAWTTFPSVPWIAMAIGIVVKHR
jgi:hypothetical protein